MKKKDVPQDNNSTLEGARKAMYAVDDNGKYIIVPSTGWEAEEIVTEMAVDHYKQLAEKTLQRTRQGISTPLEYHMYVRRFNIVTLAQAVDMFQWRVKRHLKPSVFNKLSTTMLARYADALNIHIEQLCSIPHSIPQ